MNNKLIALAGALSLTVLAPSFAADQPVVIKAVGTWGNLTNYQKHEGPFWNERIAEASDGQIIGEIKPQTELGLKGFEIMRLVKNGVFDFAFGLPGYATSLGDFVEGAGGTSVTIPFAEVIPALEKGVADCGITGTMSAYKANWHQVATHAYTLRVGWGLAFGAMNMDKWNAMSAEQQELLTAEVTTLTDEMWTETATEDDVAIACITGGDCAIGEPGAMTLVEPSEDDLAIRDEIADDVVLARWAERCGEDCAATWNETVGKVLGMTAAAK